MVSMAQSNGPTLTIANNSWLSNAEAQTALRTNQSLKIVSDDALQRLLDVLGGCKFFDYSTSVEPPRSHTMLTIYSDDQPYVMTSKNRVAEAMEAWVSSLGLFMTAYNTAESFTGRNMSAEQLKAASNRLNRGADKKP